MFKASKILIFVKKLQNEILKKSEPKREGK